MDESDRKPPPVTPSSISFPPVMSEDRTPSAASSGSVYLTPSSGISEDVFDWTFNRHVLNNLDDFILELGPAVKEWGGNKFAATAAATNAELRAACAGEDSDLREYMKNWFNSISNSSAAFGGEEAQPNKKPRVSRSRAEKPASGAILNEDTKKSQFKTVFTNYARRIKEANAYENAYALNDFPDDPRGSLVTERSTKNLAFYVPTSNILFEGEVKNNKNYKKDDAIRQCAGYLYFQLWWFRTVQRRDVEAVYGFTVCGSECSDDNTVTVSLLALKVPDQTKPSIGGKYELYEFSQIHHDDSSAAFDLLGSFLLIDFDNPFKKPYIPERFHCPGCMLMPPSWLREGSEEQNNADWAMIKTGTGSLVIRCNNKDVVLRLLENHVRNRDSGQKCDLYMVREAVPGSMKWILKCKTPASGKGWESAGAAINQTILQLRNQLSREGNNDLHDIAGKWLDMYPVLAVVDRHAGRSIVVTRYMGDDFSASKISYANFISEFKMLIDRVIGLEEAIDLVHGDIHEGNIRLDKKGDVGWKLRLIDWDEASIDFATARTAVTDEQKKRYPDCLLKCKGNLYTKNQLLLLFSSLNKKYNNDGQREQWEKVPGVNWEHLVTEVDYKGTPDELLPAAVANKYDLLYDSLEVFKEQGQGQTTYGAT